MLRIPLLAALAVLAPIAMAETRIAEADLTIAAELRDAALRENLGFAITESLTTEVGPRLAGTEADARAVAWAQAKFEELGFDRVWTQPVTFPVWERGEQQAEVVSPVRQRMFLTALGGTVGTEGRAIEAEVVEFETLEALAAADPASVQGRIAFISNRMERTRDGSGYGRAVIARTQGATVAGRKGAVALVIRTIGTADSRTPNTGIMRYGDTPTRIPAAALSNPDADQLQRLLRRGEPVVLRLRLGARTRSEYTSHNVIGDILGSERPEEIVLLGAHLDSWDVGTGALDDAAGIGITMAAAHLILQRGQRPRRTLRVVAFANEEQGLYGARVYRDLERERLHQHILAAESDFGAGRIWRFDTRVAPEALSAIEQMMTVLAPLGIERGHNEANGGPDLTFLRESGVPVVGLLQDGTRYFDYHHTENDTLDKIDPEELTQNVAAYAAFAWMALQAEGDFGRAPKAEDLRNN